MCHLYGEGEHIDATLARSAEPVRSVTISEDSRFQNFESSVYRIETIICNLKVPMPLRTSHNYKGKFHNDDGTTTIQEPKFLLSNTNLPISSSSDLNGVCMLYGLTSYVEHSRIDHVISDGSNANATIASNAHLEYGPIIDFYNIESLICQ